MVPNISEERQERISARFKALVESLGLQLSATSVPQSSPSYAGAGYAPGFKAGPHRLTVWNIAAYLEQTVQAPQANLSLRLQDSSVGATIRRITCTITDRQGRARKGVPVDLWLQSEVGLRLIEKRTDKSGRVEFDIREEELPWLTLGVGTVDGKTSIKDFKTGREVDFRH